MRIVTWNVNSVRARLERLTAYLTRARPDVVCLQEIKVVDGDFPLAPLRELGYHVETFGQKTYNGVALLAREPMKDVARGLADGETESDARLIAATVDGIRVVNVYVPNGQAVGSEKYAYKLRWLARLRAALDRRHRADEALLVTGDFNVAPEDRDVWDPAKWRDQVLFSEPEKAALRELCAFGLVDALRLHSQEAGIYTWWDYRMGAFHRGWGLRIDHFLLTKPLAARCRAVAVERDERKGKDPSDHAPIVATLDAAG